MNTFITVGLAIAWITSLLQQRKTSQRANDFEELSSALLLGLAETTNTQDAVESFVNAIEEKLPAETQNRIWQLLGQNHGIQIKQYGVNQRLTNNSRELLVKVITAKVESNKKAVADEVISIIPETPKTIQEEAISSLV
ncbi:MAG: hypothetical protein R3B92_02130 [Patescibacteria group bacterium]